MKRALNWTIGCIALATVVGSHAEPARKGAVPKGVDLDAAAKATAALYANLPASQEQAAPAPKVRPYASPAQPVRSSPLLPPAAVPAQPAAVQQAVGEVWAGAYHCEHAEKVSLRPGHGPEQVELQWKNQRWQMQRIDSRSGAMRLEDATARMVWIQLPNKSMLLDQRQGRRLLDECQHDVQVQTAAQMKTNPPPALFDTTGMGR
mgnify:CR=1 FL=1